MDLTQGSDSSAFHGVKRLSRWVAHLRLLIPTWLHKARPGMFQNMTSAAGHTNHQTSLDSRGQWSTEFAAIFNLPHRSCLRLPLTAPQLSPTSRPGSLRAQRHHILSCGAFARTPPSLEGSSLTPSSLPRCIRVLRLP